MNKRFISYIIAPVVALCMFLVIFTRITEPVHANVESEKVSINEVAIVYTGAEMGLEVTNASVTCTTPGVDIEYWWAYYDSYGKPANAADLAIMFHDGIRYTLFVYIRPQEGYELAESVNLKVNGRLNPSNSLLHREESLYKNATYPCYVRVDFDGIFSGEICRAIVGLDPNGGAFEDGSTSKRDFITNRSGQLMDIPSPVRSGKCFVHWRKAADGAPSDDEFLLRTTPLNVEEIGHRYRAEWREVHALEFIEGKEAGIREEGVVPHYWCQFCKECYLDSRATQHVEDPYSLVIPGIEPPLVDAVWLSTSQYTYDGKVKTPTVYVRNTSGELLTKDVDYDITHIDSGRKNVGTYRYRVTMKGLYSGDYDVYFKINPKRTTIYKPYRYKGAVKARWARQSSKMSSSRIYGYQVAYARKSDFSDVKYKYAKGYKKTSYKITKLKRKTYYYVKVRTRLKTGNKFYYSAWSKVRKVKTK